MIKVSGEYLVLTKYKNAGEWDCFTTEDPGEAIKKYKEIMAQQSAGFVTIGEVILAVTINPYDLDKKWFRD